MVSYTFKRVNHHVYSKLFPPNARTVPWVVLDSSVQQTEVTRLDEMFVSASDEWSNRDSSFSILVQVSYHATVRRVSVRRTVGGQ